MSKRKDGCNLGLFQTSSLEGDTCVGSVGVSPLQRRDEATVLPYPECPEESDVIMVGAWEGLPRPVSVLPALPGIPSPDFPRVEGFCCSPNFSVNTVSESMLHGGTIHISTLNKSRGYSTTPGRTYRGSDI